MKRKKVCIIGAGASGLVAIRHMSQSSELVGTVFEGRGDLGGVWDYQPKTNSGATYYGPMYKNMRTNLPTQLMGFADFPFPEAFSAKQQNPSSFLHHSEVLEFLHSYAEDFQLREHIHFHRRVVDIRPILSEPEQRLESSAPRWRVTVVHDTNSAETKPHDDQPLVEEFEFDAVLICNGHFSKPAMPHIENLEDFQGTVLHSKDYDDPGRFADQCVLIVGFGPSGVDISLEIAEIASKVIISNIRDERTFPLPRNICYAAKIKSATRDGFLCENGELISCDAIILCTGYVFEFPFLSPECGVSIEKSKRISPLYLDMIHAKFTTLCFIGIQLHVGPFLLFDCQIRFCVKLFEGLVKLPSMAIMLEEIAKDREFRTSLNPSSLSWSHQLGPRQWKYYETLAKEAKFELPNLDLLSRIYEKTRIRRWQSPRVYKNDFIYATKGDPNSFCYVEAPELTD